jgi:hypothetical protein
LESFVRVRAHLATWPEHEHVLASGQIAVEALGTLRPFAPRRSVPGSRASHPSGNPTASW